MAIGDLVRARREALGLSQAQLGERCGISGPQVSRIESGVRGLSLETLAKLARELELDAAETFAALAEQQ